jgi:hypothetical protein
MKSASATNLDRNSGERSGGIWGARSHPAFLLSFRPVTTRESWYSVAASGWERAQKRMMTEEELREKLRKISALFEGATTNGERDAAAAAIARVRKALHSASQTEQTVEMKFKLPDHWRRRLFIALCRRYDVQPYRYRGQRHTTVVLRAPRSFIENTLWPEFLQIKDALDEYLNEATERIIREEVYGDAAEAAERSE